MARRLHITIIEASNLLNLDSDNQLNPYVVLRLKNQDKKDFEKTEVKKNTTNPVWNQKFNILAVDPNDVLLINIYNKCGKKDEKIIDELQFPINSFQILAPLVRKEIDLKLKKKKNFLAAGRLLFEVEAYEPEESKPRNPNDIVEHLIKTDGCKVHIKCFDAKDVMKINLGAKPDPYLKFTIRDTVVKSNIDMKTTNPVWNQELDIISTNPESDTLEVQLVDNDLNRNEPMMNPILIPLADHPFGDHYVFDDYIKLKRKNAGKLHFELDFSKATDIYVHPASVHHAKKAKPVEKVEEKPIEKVEEKPIEKVEEKPVEKVEEKPVEQTVQEPVVEPVTPEKPVEEEKTVERDVQEIVEEPKLVEQEVQVTAEEPAAPEQPVEEPKQEVKEPVVEPATPEKVEEPKFVEASVQTSVVEPATLEQPVEEPKPTESAVQEPVVEPVTPEKVEEPVVEPAAPEKVEEPVVEEEKVEEPVTTEKVEEHVEEPVVEEEKVEEPVEEKPVEQPTENHVVNEEEENDISRINGRSHLKIESLKGVLIKANRLPKTNSNGSDTYAVVTVISKAEKDRKVDKVKTAVHHSSQDPVWNKKFDFRYLRDGDTLRVDVFQSHKIVGDQCIAFAEIPLKCISENKEIEQTYQLQKPAKVPKAIKKVTDFGTITFSLIHNVQYN